MNINSKLKLKIAFFIWNYLQWRRRTS